MKFILYFLFFNISIVLAAERVIFSIHELKSIKGIEKKIIYVSGFYVDGTLYKDKKSAYEFTNDYIAVSIDGDFSESFYKNCLEKKSVLLGQLDSSEKGRYVLKNIEGLWVNDNKDFNCISYKE